jgi:hypothetical protein
MSASRTLGIRHLNKTHKVSIAGIAAVATASLAFSLTPGNASADSHPQSHAAAASVSASAPVALTTAKGSAPATVHKNVATQLTTTDVAAKAHAAAVAKAAAKAHAEQKAVAALHAKDDAKAKAKAAAKVKAAAHAKAKAEAAAKQHAKAAAASRSAKRAPVYTNNLDGWIRHSLHIMKQHHIPGSYEGLHRNIMRESSGNPNAINGWDINAQNGIPSKGLLQVIPPTFATYHVAGTSKNIYDPVANIVAAANYAADKYGSMDNVNSAY